VIPTATAGCFRKSPRGWAGRIDPAATTFASANDLASAMRRASVAHGEHEKRIGAADPNWPNCTPRTWWRSRLEPSCQSEQLRREPQTGTRRPTVVMDE